MSDEIKDKNGLEEEKSPNLENSSTESEQDAAEDANEEISTEEHSDYKPVNRFDALCAERNRVWRLCKGTSGRGAAFCKSYHACGESYGL